MLRSQVERATVTEWVGDVLSYSPQDARVAAGAAGAPLGVEPFRVGHTKPSRIQRFKRSRSRCRDTPMPRVAVGAAGHTVLC